MIPPQHARDSRYFTPECAPGADVCCGGGGPTMGLPVDKAEIDRVLPVPLDMLCSPRYARLEDSYSPTDNGVAPAQHEDERWSDFTCKLLFCDVSHVLCVSILSTSASVCTGSALTRPHPWQILDRCFILAAQSARLLLTTAGHIQLYGGSPLASLPTTCICYRSVKLKLHPPVDDSGVVDATCAARRELET